MMFQEQCAYFIYLNLFNLSIKLKYTVENAKPTLLLLSRFSRVRLCATPKTAAHQAPPSLGFSRQEHEWVAVSFSNA